jgi:hypothetical protein
MNKYLFTDETGVVREVEAEDELHQLIQASRQPELVRIWVFRSHEWISYAEFQKRFTRTSPAIAIKPEKTQAPLFSKRRFKNIALFTLAGATVFLVYNFTRIRWEKASSLNTMAARPANVPSIDVDSVISLVEFVRGQKLDKVTRTNLRIRNNWPDLISLRLEADRDTSREGNRYTNARITVDNATGYQLDEATAQVRAWKDHAIISTDTFHFNNIGYASPATRDLQKTLKADSLSVTFSLIKARSFNFCYSADKKSNYGNLADRWFCKD